MKRKFILIVCEGKIDRAFLIHLQSLFQSRTNNLQITVRQRKIGGGSPYDIVLYAMRTRRAFSCRIALFDTDRPKNEIQKAEQLARENEIHTLKVDVCLEKLLLQILGHRIRNYHSCEQYKKQFHKHYIPATKMQKSQEYKAMFPRPLLQKQRRNIPLLNTIINYIQHGCDKK